MEMNYPIQNQMKSFEIPSSNSLKNTKLLQSLEAREEQSRYFILGLDSQVSCSFFGVTLLLP